MDGSGGTNRALEVAAQAARASQDSSTEACHAGAALSAGLPAVPGSARGTCSNGRAQRHSAAVVAGRRPMHAVSAPRLAGVGARGHVPSTTAPPATLSVRDNLLSGVKSLPAEVQEEMVSRYLQDMGASQAAAADAAAAVVGKRVPAAAPGNPAAISGMHADDAAARMMMLAATRGGGGGGGSGGGGGGQPLGGQPGMQMQPLMQPLNGGSNFLASGDAPRSSLSYPQQGGGISSGSCSFRNSSIDSAACMSFQQQQQQQRRRQQQQQEQLLYGAILEAHASARSSLNGRGSSNMRGSSPMTAGSGWASPLLYPQHHQQLPQQPQHHQFLPQQPLAATPPPAGRGCKAWRTSSAPEKYGSTSTYPAAPSQGMFGGGHHEYSSTSGTYPAADSGGMFGGGGYGRSKSLSNEGQKTAARLREHLLALQQQAASLQAAQDAAGAAAGIHGGDLGSIGGLASFNRVPDANAAFGGGVAGPPAPRQGDGGELAHPLGSASLPAGLQASAYGLGWAGGDAMQLPIPTPGCMFPFRLRR